MATLTHWKAWLLCALAAGVITVAAAVTVVVAWLSTPSDDSASSLFASKRPRFDELAKMIQEDADIHAIGTDCIGGWFKRGDEWWRSGGEPSRKQSDLLQQLGLARDRYDRYLALLSEVGAYRVAIWKQDGVDEVRTLWFRRGLVPSSQAKDFAFFPTGPPSSKTFVSSTDTPITRATPSVLYRDLGSNWAIRYEWD